MRKLILGTAGHIDHGKTTLVRALTGVDTDRLAEEKRRGITIDLGFARLELEGGTELGIVDVPGHEAFVRNMLAGATGIDLVLLVVAADEGVMPQTREHLAIVDLLGVRGGVVAVTKSDLVDAEWLELVLADIRDGLEGSPFADAPIVPVSAATGAGLDTLRAALASAADTVVERSVEDLARLPIDRVFSVRGTGTVVTGTLWSGRIERDATVRVLPAGRTARVRGVQVHGTDVERAEAGRRVAVALAGIERSDIVRGDVLVTDGAWEASRMLTVRLRLLADTEWELRPRQRIRFHLGTAEVMGRVALLGRARLGAGEEGWAQLRLEAPVVARAGDRFVIRSYSPVTTIGGGIVAEPAPPKRKRLHGADPERLAAVLTGSPSDAILARTGAGGWSGVPARSLPIETPLPPAVAAEAVTALEASGRILRAGDRLFDADLAGQGRDLLLAAVDAYHATHPLDPGIDREALRRALPAAAHAALGESILDRLLTEGTLAGRGGAVARAGFRTRLSAEQERARDRLLALLAEAGTTPPTLGELPGELAGRDDFRAILRLLEGEGAVVAVSTDLYFARDAVREAADAVRRALAGREDLGPADFKAALPLSRKYLIPLLEYFDRTGITVRRGDRRAVPSDGSPAA
ncbi:MAG TPA: selenocysteine-specific translation elongation factor [Longimicrobiales bacterium]